MPQKLFRANFNRHQLEALRFISIRQTSKEIVGIVYKLSLQRLFIGLTIADCQKGDRLNQFLITGRGGLPANPEEILRGEATLSAEWLSLPETTTTNDSLQKKADSTPSKLNERIVEAQGIIIGSKGQIILTKKSTRSQFEVPWLANYYCQKRS